ncbi:16S rRNA (cytidine(1402)-2'-O)-methyltransferase [Patescibacteria group bacterium]|nr:16S rRNA (cytidine(1402)-2'-O)-methyltransferase [Patescibacteria group bacterium]
MGTLYIVATPIGNLKDITLRALETLQEVDFVLAEDTRVTKKLLSHYNIQTPLISYHQHSKESVLEKVFQLLLEQKNLALVTDAGTPGISDPGNELIAFLLKKNLKISVVPIPGPSALTALASIAGISTDKFLFLGYPPHKKGRKKFFEEVAQSKHPVLFYESPHRIMKSLKELEVLDPNLSLIVGRELTKKFETIYRGSSKDIQKKLEENPIKGEFVLLVHLDREYFFV